MNQDKKVRLTKLSDDKFEGKHPNGIIQGYVKEGIAPFDVEVGVGFAVINPETYRTFLTTQVTEVTSDGFKTLNSTYKLENL